MATKSGRSTQSAADTFTGFSSYELAYLLSDSKDATADKSREVLGLDLASDAEAELLTSGATSLLARGLLEVAGDSARLNGVANAAAYVLREATRWSEIALLSAERVDGAVFIKAPRLSLLCQPRAFGTWRVIVTPGDVTSAEVARLLLEGEVSESTGTAGISLVSSRLDITTTMAVSRTKDSAWTVIVGDSPLHEEIAPRPSTPEEIGELLALLLADEPLRV